MKYIIILAVVLGIAAVGVSNSYAATSMYMKYGTIQGDSLSSTHSGWISIGSYQFGITKPTTVVSGTREYGVPSISDITITKMMDKSSVPLMQEAFAGLPQTVTIDLTRTGTTTEQTYAEYQLSNAVVTGYSVSYASGSEVPIESINIAFTKIIFEYWPSNLDGTLGSPMQVGWDLTKNTLA